MSTSAWEALRVTVTREQRDGETIIECQLYAAPRPPPAKPVLRQAEGHVDVVVFAHELAPMGPRVNMSLETEVRSVVRRWLSPDAKMGDATFDDEVFIGGSLPALPFLQREEVRAHVRRLLQQGAVVELNDRLVRVTLPGAHSDDPPGLLALVKAYVEFAED